MNCDKYKRVVISLAAGGLLLVGSVLLVNSAALTAHAAPGDLFVTPGGGGTCSQADPCDLQKALTTAASGDVIYVAQGIYTGTGTEVMDVTESITVYGGWDGAAGGPVVRDPDTYSTIVDGQDQRRGVVVGSGLDVTLEGFTVTDGMATSQGAGLYAHNATLILRGMTFDSNAIDIHATPGTYAYGGGAFVEGGTLHVEATTFVKNSVWASTTTWGGGLLISHTVAATVTNSLFTENDAWHGSGLYFEGAGASPLLLSDSSFVGNGGGTSGGAAFCGYAGAIKLRYAQAHVEGNTFRGNQASQDEGAVSVYYSSLLLASNVITGNQSGETAALYLASVSPLTATNNIIAGNRGNYDWARPPAVRVRVGTSGRFLHNTVAHNDSYSGLFLQSSSTVWLTNTILVSHTVGISVGNSTTAVLEGTLWGSGAWANTTDWGGGGTIITGTVNVWGNPVFVSPDNGDYHIFPTSAAAGRGVDAGVMTDIDGDARPAPAGTAPDIGADEVLQRMVYLPMVVRNY